VALRFVQRALDRQASRMKSRELTCKETTQSLENLKTKMTNTYQKPVSKENSKVSIEMIPKDT